MNAELEASFREALVEAYRRAINECGYRGNYALRMVNEMGAVTAAKQLINSHEPAEGFASLLERRRLDLTVEAIALRPEFQPLFTPEEIHSARERLRQCGYDPDVAAAEI